MIAIVDYGAGNLRSVENALTKIGASSEPVRDAAALARAEKIVLPGVGHFGQMMQALDALALRQPLRERIRAGVPFLGICLGMQALYETSAEAPEARGLGILPGRVIRFGAEARVPHMGWNTIRLTASSACLTSGYAYFAHSYYVPVGSETIATCEYGQPFAAAVEKDNCLGVQFHPEKSGELGLEIFRRFAAQNP